MLLGSAAGGWCDRRGAERRTTVSPQTTAKTTLLSDDGAQSISRQPTFLSKAWDWLTANPNNAPISNKLLPRLASESDQAFSAMGVPQEFARAIFGTEGGLKPDGSAQTSSAGAVRAGQLMPGTAAMYGRARSD